MIRCTMKAPRPSAFQMGGRTIRIVLGACVLFGATLTDFAHAATLDFNLMGTSLDPNLSISASPGYTATLTNSGAIFKKPANLPNGSVNINSNFTFSGQYSVSVDVYGLRSGTATRAEGGLRIRGGNTFSDIYSYNDTPNTHNNYLKAASMTDIKIGSNEDLLTISGNTRGSLYSINLFLQQEYGGKAANALTFSDLTVTATSFQNVATVSPVPIPGALPLFGSAMIGVAALSRRRNRHKGVPTIEDSLFCGMDLRRRGDDGKKR